MEEKALEILKILNNNHYEAYVVGGYVTDTLLNRKTNEVIAHINSITNNTVHELHQLLEPDNKIDKVHIDNLIEKYTKEIDSLNTMDSGVFGKEDLVELCETFIINLRGIINE